MLNIKNAKRLRDAVASDPEMFNMSWIGQPACGTPGCIAGWGIALAGLDKELPEEEAYEVMGCRDVSAWLGLDVIEGDFLFLGELSPLNINSLNITHQDALNTLDRLIETGEVVWPEHVRSYYYG